MKNSTDTIGNQIHDLAACSAVPQPTLPPHFPLRLLGRDFFFVQMGHDAVHFISIVKVL